MAMKETVRSLKAYFILSGLISGALNVSAFLRGEAALGRVIALVGLGFAMAYLYAGFRLRQLLATAPGQVLKLLIAGAVFLALLFGLDLLSGMTGGTLPSVIVGLLITWYLFVNVRRLAAEAQAKPAVAVT
jgi:hypothetical protein